MPMSANFQLALELTNLFPVRELAGQVYHRILGFARDLKRSGSDIVVEEDLAATFGRGKLDQEIEKKFKSEVLRDSEIHSFQKDCEISLDTRSGPTVHRAVTDSDNYYMSTVVQLSLLGWAHDRSSLATVLAECMNKRFDMQLPDARPNPGYDGIYSMLQACSTQTSNFNWAEYLQLVEYQLGFVDIPLKHNPYLVLSPNLLLTAMDCLYIMQKFPEDRKMIVKSTKGVLTLIVWAHYVLNLAVLVKGSPRGDVIFGTEPIQIYILCANPTDGEEVCLLDGKSEILLRVEKNEFDFTSLRACERLPLLNYGTTIIYRMLHFSASCPDQVILDAAQMAVAMAIVNSMNLNRSSSHESPLIIERWRIQTVVELMFKDLHLNMKAIDTFVATIMQQEEGDDEVLPRSVELHLAKTKGEDHFGFIMFKNLLGGLSALIVLLSNTSGIEHGSTLPLSVDISAPHFLANRIGYWQKTNVVSEHQMLSYFAGVLIGNFSYESWEANQQIDDRTFLISDFCQGSNGSSSMH